MVWRTGVPFLVPLKGTTVSCSTERDIAHKRALYKQGKLQSAAPREEFRKGRYFLLGLFVKVVQCSVSKNIQVRYDPRGRVRHNRTKEFGAHLRLLRKRAGLSLPQTAAACGYSYSTVWRLESGGIGPTKENVERLAQAFCLSDHEKAEFIALSGIHSGEDHGRISLWQEAATARAQTTSLFRGYELVCIPGHLQTPPYMRAIFSTFHEDEGEIEIAMRHRCARQKAMLDEEKRFLFVINEVALRNRYTSLSDHITQLIELISLMDLRNVEIRILPLATRVSLMPFLGFSIHDTIDVELETLTKLVRFNTPDKVNHHISVFNEFRASALVGRDAKLFVSSIIEKLRGQADEDVTEKGEWDPRTRRKILSQTYEHLLPQTRNSS